MGSYISNNLIKDETVQYETHLHWKIFISLRGLFTLFIAPYIRLKTSEFGITNKRVIVKTGFISRKTLEMNLNKIETVNVEQSIWGRIFGFGTIIIVGTGGTREVFHDIKSPLLFRRKFQELSS
jgi:uncharacterized membrane protein YdbT with pleckstrin-like domain